jgi:predicted DCC family thiol-disulfide oxidoreductase YuxK
VLCSRWVAFVIAHDPEARYRFVPIQTPRGRQLAERFHIDAENPETNVIIYDRLAQNRYRLFGRHASCLVPTPDVASRFLADAAEASGAERS